MAVYFYLAVFEMVKCGLGLFILILHLSCNQMNLLRLYILRPTASCNSHSGDSLSGERVSLHSMNKSDYNEITEILNTRY
jgi:hypothetical protein